MFFISDWDRTFGCCINSIMNTYRVTRNHWSMECLVLYGVIGCTTQWKHVYSRAADVSGTVGIVLLSYMPEGGRNTSFSGTSHRLD